MHGCTLVDFSVEGRGSDHGNFVLFRGSCHGLPWKSVGFHVKGHDFPLYMEGSKKRLNATKLVALPVS